MLVVVLLVILGTAQRSEAASAGVINAEVDATFHSFVEQIGGARELANKAAGILVFPSVVKAGMGWRIWRGTLACPPETRCLLQLDIGLVWLSARRARALRNHHVHDRRSAC